MATPFERSRSRRPVMTAMRLGVGPHHLAEARGQVGQPLRVVLHLEQEVERPENAAGADDPVGREHVAGPLSAEAGRRLDGVAAERAIARPYRGRLGLGEELHPASFGEVEVVPVERVLRPHATARHAGAAERAPGSLRAGSVEVRVGDRLAGSAEEDRHVGRAEVLLAPHLDGDIAQDLVPRHQPRVRRGAEHVLGGHVVRGELSLASRASPAPRPVRKNSLLGTGSVFAYTSDPPPTPTPEKSSRARRRSS